MEYKQMYSMYKWEIWYLLLL